MASALLFPDMAGASLSLELSRLCHLQLLARDARKSLKLPSMALPISSARSSSSADRAAPMARLELLAASLAGSPSSSNPLYRAPLLAENACRCPGFCSPWPRAPFLFPHLRPWQSLALRHDLALVPMALGQSAVPISLKLPWPSAAGRSSPPWPWLSLCRAGSAWPPRPCRTPLRVVASQLFPERARSVYLFACPEPQRQPQLGPALCRCSSCSARRVGRPADAVSVPW